MSSAPKASQMHRPHRLLLLCLWTAATLSLLGAAGAAYGAVLFGRIDRFDAPLDDPKAVPDDAPVVVVPPGAGDPVEILPPLGPPGPAINILIVGTDNSEGIPEDDPILTRREDSNLADVLMLLRVDSERGLVSLLSVPRDLWVPIDGVDYSLKINSAFDFQSDTKEEQRNTRLLNTFRSALDVPVHHMVIVNWAGFRGLVDLVGGVEVCFPLPTRDLSTGLLIETAGTHELDGVDALAYVRSRKISEQDENGDWSATDGTADLGRIARQQEFFRLVIDQTTEVWDPTKLHSIAFKALDNVTIDQALTVDAMLDLARRFAGLEGDGLRTAVLDVTDIVGIYKGQELAAVDLVDTAANEMTLDIFRGIEPTDVAPKRVSIQLLGANDEQVAMLDGEGFVVAEAGESETERTTVAYGRDGQWAAYLVASYVEGDVLYVLDGSLLGLEIKLELAPGANLLTAPVTKGILPPAHPTFTAPTSTTTTSDDLVTTTTQPSLCL